MDFLDAKLDTRDGTLRPVDGSGRITRPDTALHVAGTSRVTVGIRPEDVRLVDSGDIVTTAGVVEPVGSDDDLYLDACLDFTTESSPTPCRPVMGT